MGSSGGGAATAAVVGGVVGAAVGAGVAGTVAATVVGAAVAATVVGGTVVEVVVVVDVVDVAGRDAAVVGDHPAIVVVGGERVADERRALLPGRRRSRSA